MLRAHTGFAILLAFMLAACGSGDGGSDTPDAAPPAYCPSNTLPAQTSVSYNGSTIGANNLFTSSRLEWGDAGDNALLYTVPQTGTYAFGMSDNLTTNGGCGISIDSNPGGFHTPALCPAMGQSRDLPDAFFVAGEGFPGQADLTANQQLLILVSCATWSTPATEVDYTLTIMLQ